MRSADLFVRRQIASDLLVWLLDVARCFPSFLTVLQMACGQATPEVGVLVDQLRVHDADLYVHACRTFGGSSGSFGLIATSSEQT
jgi:hypothetical protein